MSEPAFPAYKVLFTEDAKNDVSGLDGSIRNQLKKVVEKKLATNPEEYGTPLRSVLTGYWKHEFAAHRVIYQIPPGDMKRVVVCAVGPRKAGDMEDIYNQLGKVVVSGRVAGQIQAALGFILPPKKKR